MPQRMLALVALGQFLGLTLWFSATAAAPRIAAELALSASATAWLTIAVQGGFVDPHGHVWFVGDHTPLGEHGKE